MKNERQRQRLDHQSDGLTDPGGTTDQSASPGYSDPDITEDNILDSEDEDFIEAETVTIRSTDTLAQCSAECIALSLLSQVGSGRLPPVDRVPWLVSRDMADQDLLPLPSSLPVDPDMDMVTQDIRGTLTWAPPRPQIVLTVQTVPAKRTLALSSQRWRCAGCGMKVGIMINKFFFILCFQGGAEILQIIPLVSLSWKIFLYRMPLQQQPRDSCQDHPSVELQQVSSVKLCSRDS